MIKDLKKLFLILKSSLFALLIVFTAVPEAGAGDDIEWLKERSMLVKAEELTKEFSGKGTQWKHPYGNSRPQDFLEMGSVWFAVYPAAIVGDEGQSVLQVLSDKQLLETFSDIGIEALHTGPLKRAGSIEGRQYKPTIDGHFDRIELAIDPEFGNDEQYRAMVKNADSYRLSIIGDLVPGHTGKGADFRLAERGVEGFPGIYAMVEIPREGWSLLPEVPEGDNSVNLSPETVQALKDRKYIVGPLEGVIFARPGIKESNWSVTEIIKGVDGRDRRWAYVHMFKNGQPSLNWLDPGFAAQRVLAGDVLHSLNELGTRAFRMDATMFLGFGPRQGEEKGWLFGHPLSNHATETMAMLIRKFGGYSFQELNIDLGKIADSMSFGPELSYDFMTRPAYLYALVTGDAGPLRLILREMLAYKVRPMRMVHALQNHDELMLEATHLKVHGEKMFQYEGEEVKGGDLFKRLYQEPIAKTTGEGAPYNEKFAMSPGVCSTMAGFTAAAIGVNDLAALSPEQVSKIRNIHLASAAYNALQPGAFVLSGWDMVGALPVQRESVQERLADNDCRWLNRGAYDLMGSHGKIRKSSAGLPRAVSLYGSLPDQLKDADSFVSRLKEMLKIRKKLQISKSRVVSVPQVSGKGVVLIINELPHSEGESPRLQVSAINFGSSTVEEVIRYEGIKSLPFQAIFSTRHGPVAEKVVTKENFPLITLEPFEATIIVQERD